MKDKTRICLVVCILFISCFDILKEKQVHLVGNISLINPDNQEDKGYKMVLYSKNFNSNIVEDYIIDVIGDDSVLIVKAISKKDCSDTYYKISHYKGLKLKEITSFDENHYLQMVNAKFKYNFHDNTNLSSICP